MIWFHKFRRIPLLLIPDNHSEPLMTKPTGNPRGRPARQTVRTKQLQELWQRAWNAPVEIPCESKAAAVSVRFQLYNSVKALRGNPDLNPELAEIVEGVQVSLTGDDSATVVLKRSEATRALNNVFTALKVTGDAVKTKTEEDLEIDASLTRLQELLKEQGTPPVREGETDDPAPRPARVTPYYTR